jgi:hypothetical protein
MGKGHVITYGEAVQVSCDDFRFIRTSKIITEETSVYDMVEWLKSLGVKDPDLTMIDFSTLDNGDT